MIVVSTPYMCCGGTVPSMEKVPPAATSRRLARARAANTSDLQVFACGCGRPVLPDVNTIIATCPAGMEGMASVAGDLAGHGGTIIAGNPAGNSLWSARQQASGWLAKISRTTPAARLGGNRLA